MIKYDPLWDTLKKRGISQYSLIKDYGIDKAQLQRLRSNMVVKTMILNRLCTILDCRIEDIMVYVPDAKETEQKRKNSKRYQKKSLIPLLFNFIIS